MKNITLKTMTAIATIAAASAAQSATIYSQDFEGVSLTDSAVVDGFIIGNINNDGGGQWFEGFVAPANGAGQNGYSNYIQEGGDDQGDFQLSTFSDYNGWSPFTGGVESLTTVVYKDIGTIEAGDLGKTMSFTFDAKTLTLESPSTSNAFIKVLNTEFWYEAAKVSVTNSEIGTDWGTYTASFEVTSDLVGGLMQIGFDNTTDAAWGATGMAYDNLSVTSASAVPVPAAAWLMGSALLGLAGISRSRK